MINLSYAAALILEEVSPSVPSWYSTFECDIDFNLPNNSVVFGKEPGKNRRSSSGYYRLHRSERLELFRKIEGLMDLNGVNGHSCMLMALCEANELLKPGKSFVEDILHVVFRIPHGRGDEFEAEGYNEPTNAIFCDSLKQSCHFSLLRFLLQE